MVRLALSALLLITLASSSGCCLLQEFWYALPGRRCSLFSLSPCLNGVDCKHGCGQMYWGEVSDPPCVCGDCCDQCGHWGGQPTYAGYLPPGRQVAGYAAAERPRNYVQNRQHGHQRQQAAVNPRPASQRRQLHQVATRQEERYPLPRAPQLAGAPTDYDMQLPPGAKILNRSDRVLGEGESMPENSVASQPEPAVRTTRYQQPARERMHR